MDSVDEQNLNELKQLCHQCGHNWKGQYKGWNRFPRECPKCRTVFYKIRKEDMQYLTPWEKKYYRKKELSPRGFVMLAMMSGMVKLRKKKGGVA